MNFWNRRNKIEFFNSDPSIIDNYPIIESKNLKLNWVNRAKENYKNLVKQGINNEPGFKHLSKCPGIFDLFKYGYIIPLHKDFIIKPKEPKEKYEGFEVTFPSKTENSMEGTDKFYIDKQEADLVANPPWAANFIVKINTGWNVIAPKGIKFLLLPIAYPDTYIFTSTIGILDPTISTQINFQMYWNTEETVIIRAGAPLGHLIPLSEKKYKMVQRLANQKDRHWMEKVSSTHSSSFWNTPVRSKLVNMYNKYWNS